jgi:hypothetical protein
VIRGSCASRKLRLANEESVNLSGTLRIHRWLLDELVRADLVVAESRDGIRASRRTDMRILRPMSVGSFTRDGPPSSYQKSNWLQLGPERPHRAAGQRSITHFEPTLEFGIDNGLYDAKSDRA